MSKEQETAQPAAWLEIHNDRPAAAALEARVEARLRQRGRDRGTDAALAYPPFGHAAGMPDPPAGKGGRLAPLYHHLRQLNERPAPDVGPVLAPSPATRLPLIGRLWRMVREQAHSLVLFYVGRLAAHDTVTRRHLVSTVNELTRLLQEQEAELERLRREVDELRGDQPR